MKNQMISFSSIIFGVWFSCVATIGFAQLVVLPNVSSEQKVIPLEEFERQPFMSQLIMSPDGKYFSGLNVQGNQLLIAIDLVENAGQLDPVRLEIPLGANLSWFKWANNDRLVYSYTIIGYSNAGLPNNLLTVISAVNADGADAKFLLIEEKKLNDFNFDLIHLLPDDESSILLSVPGKRGVNTQVEKLNIYTGELTRVQRRYKSISNWIADADGNIHAGVGVKRGVMEFFVRSPDRRNRWVQLENDDLIREGEFQPISYSKDPQVIYVASPIGGGRVAIYSFNLGTGEIVDKIFEHPEVDVDRVLISPVSRELLGVTYVSDKLEYYSVDDVFAENIKYLNSVLPNTSNEILDITNDGRYFLIYATGPRNPGSYYRFDVVEKRLRLFMESYPEFPIENLAAQRVISYFARDGVEIKAYLTIPDGGLEEGASHPVILLPHSNPQGRDYMTYNVLAQFMANRGYLVMQPNYRGSGGYGLLFSGLGYGEWGQAMQNDLTDAVDWLALQSFADTERVCMLGFEYAGYAALIAASQEPQVYKCAMAIQPVIDLQGLILQLRNGEGANEESRALASSITSYENEAELAQISPLQSVDKVNIPLLFSMSLPDSEGLVPAYSNALNKGNKEFMYTPFSDSLLNNIQLFLQKHMPTTINMLPE